MCSSVLVLMASVSSSSFLLLRIQKMYLFLQKCKLCCFFTSSINLITGHLEEPMPNPMDEMTEEQKEYEAMKLVNMFDKLSRYYIIAAFERQLVPWLFTKVQCFKIALESTSLQDQDHFKCGGKCVALQRKEWYVAGLQRKPLLERTGQNWEDLVVRGLSS